MKARNKNIISYYKPFITKLQLKLLLKLYIGITSKKYYILENWIIVIQYCVYQYREKLRTQPVFFWICKISPATQILVETDSLI